MLTATGVQSEARLPFAGLHQLLRPVRERAVDLPPIQRDALNAAFGLTREVAREHYRIAMASLDLVSDVAGDAPLLLVVDDAHTGEEVAAMALGVGSDRVFGFFPNTRLFHVMMDAWGFKVDDPSGGPAGR